jgi:hypothetical protein
MRRKKTQLVAPGSGTFESPLSIIQPKIKILLKSGKDLAVRDFNGLSIKIFELLKRFFRPICYFQSWNHHKKKQSH